MILKILVLLLASIIYCYAGYPLLLKILAEIRRESSSTRTAYLPSVAMIVPAHNEEDVIREKLSNVESLSYPGRFECIIVSDSTDQTDDLVRRHANEHISHISLSKRRGKSYAVNRAARTTDAEVFVISDANTMYESTAVEALVDPLSEPDVGVTTGQLRYSSHDDSGESAYWQYELWLRRLESKLGTTVSINGGLLAIRSEDFEPLPVEALTDDFVLAMRQALAGRRITYVPAARGTESTAGGLSAEFNRRVRIGAGNYQSLVWFWKLLDPRRGYIALEFLSHKILRWVMPWILSSVAVLTVLAAYLSDGTGYWLLLAMQILCYGFVVLGLVSERLRNWSIIRIPTYFAVMNAALAVGALKYFSGPTIDIWTDTR